MKSKIRLFLKRGTLVVSLILIVVITAMSVGYAAYSTELKAMGNLVVNFLTDTEVIIETVTFNSNSLDHKNAIVNDVEFNSKTKYYKSYDESTISGVFESGTGDYVELTYRITNISSVPQKYIDFINYSNLSDSSITMPQPRMLNLKLGDVLAPGESRDVVVIYYYKGNISSTASFEANNKFIFTGEVTDVAPVMLTATIDDTIFDVTDNKLASSKIKVSNFYNVSVKYSLKLNNSKVTLVDSNENTSTYTNILNAGEIYNGNIYFLTDLDAGEEVTGLLYAELEDGTIVDISELTFVDHNTGKPKSIMTVTPRVNQQTGYLQDNQDIYFDLTNDSGKMVTSWSLIIKLKDDAPIKEISNWSANRGQWDNATKTYTIAGIDRHNGNSEIIIGVDQDYSIGQIRFTFDTNSHLDFMEYVDYIAVVEGHSDLNAIRDDKQCTGGSNLNNHKLTCIV